MCVRVCVSKTLKVEKTQGLQRMIFFVETFASIKILDLFRVCKILTETKKMRKF